MTRLLRIDASARTVGSHSRRLADFVEASWRAQNPNGKVVYRDLVKTPIPHIQNETILGFYTPASDMTLPLKMATALSDELITELKSCDEILISSPLYNLSIPSNLKAYIDQIVRVGHTFQVTEEGQYYGLLKGKKAYLALVKGANYSGTPMEAYDFQQPYLKAILSYLGIELTEVFCLEGTSHPESLELNMPKILTQIKNRFEHAA